MQLSDISLGDSNKGDRSIVTDKLKIFVNKHVFEKYTEPVT